MLAAPPEHMDNENNKIEELKKDGLSIRREAREKTLGYIMAAFGLVAGLAWNEAIKGLIDIFFPMETGGILAKFVYAALITVLVVVIGYYLVKVGKKNAGEANK